MREQDLFDPVKTYLVGQGYQVNGEVLQCDITARRGSELVVVELKRSVTVSLLVQGIRRQEIADAVYLAVPVSIGRRTIPNYGGVRALLRRLGLGLILVHFLKTKTKIEIALQPGPHEARRRNRRRQIVIREIDGRYAELNVGGSPSTTTRMTAYRQCALLIAYHLSRLETASPAQLRALGTGEKTGGILSQNHYGWFSRVSRGIYRLDPAGHEALRRERKAITEIMGFLEKEGEIRPPPR